MEFGHATLGDAHRCDNRYVAGAAISRNPVPVARVFSFNADLEPVRR